MKKVKIKAMKAKKTQKADVDRLRALFFKIGLGAAFLIVIASFNWTVYDRQVISIKPPEDITEEVEWADVVNIKREFKKPEYVQIKPVDKEVKSDTSLLNLLNQDPDENDSFALHVITEKKEVVEEEVLEFYKVEKKPHFPGGESAFFEYLGKNLSYPETELTLGIFGTVHVAFTVKSDGSLTDFEVIKGVTPNLNEEALRVLKAMPDWVPGYQITKAVSVRLIMPIRFSIMN